MIIRILNFESIKAELATAVTTIKLTEAMLIYPKSMLTVAVANFLNIPELASFLSMLTYKYIVQIYTNLCNTDVLSVFYLQ